MSKHFGHSAQNIALQTIDEVFREVEVGTAQYGVVPVENSTEGGVNQTLDCFIPNPNNPTGTWVDKGSLKDFLDVVPKQILVVVDEAYFEYAIENPSYPDSSEWLANSPNLIVTRTFSKAYGLAGLRIGYSISHPEVANLLNRVRQPFNVNSIAMTAAIAALEDTNYLNKSVALNRTGIQQLTKAFEKMGLAYIPSLGNFLAVEVNDGATTYENLLREGVIVRPIGGIYGMPRHLRVTVGLQEENEAFIRALGKVLELIPK